MPDTPTTLHQDRYAIVRLLGEGGQAATFEAVDKQRGSLVAIKRFRVRGAKSWKEVELAEREARVLASLDHPALPRYIEHFEEGGELFLVTDKIEGSSLAELRKGKRGLDEREVRRLLRDASGALDYLHGRAPPVIHRDIKPSNVIRRPDGSFALIDFGAVRDKMKPEGGSTVVGTFGYMAPEQFQGRAMPASDVYALGTTALTLLTGVEPEDLPHKGLAIDVESALRGTRVSPELRRMLTSMLEPDPDRRAGRMAPLLEELDRSRSAGDPRSAAPRGWGEQPAWAPRVPPFGETRRERRERQREERESRREIKRELRALGRPRRLARSSSALPGFLLFFALLGLTIARIVVSVVLRVALPLAFRILSIFFGKGMRQAADTMALAGKTAVESMGRAQEILRGRAPMPEGFGPRIEVDVKSPPEAKVKIGEREEGAAEEELAAEEEAAAEEERRKQR